MFLTFNFLKILPVRLDGFECNMQSRFKNKSTCLQISYYLQAIGFDYKIEELFFAAGNHIAQSQD